MNKYTKNQSLEDSSFFSTFISENENGKKRPSVRFYRYACMFMFHFLFVLSFVVDIQIIEGDITGSRFFGFHMADPFITLEIILARHQIPINLLIGAITILAFYALIAGRAFCSFVCPYNFFSEIAEAINAKLVKAKIIKKREFDPRLRYAFFIGFALASLFSGYLLFEIISPVGILTRFIIYGYSAAIWWVLFVFIFEVFYSRRFWCRYVCPIGTTYSLLTRFRAIKISWDKDKCDHCLTCINVCLVPKVLEMTKEKSKDKDGKKFAVLSGDCTLCGRCVDVCHGDALSYENRIKKLL